MGARDYCYYHILAPFSELSKDLDREVSIRGPDKLRLLIKI